MQSYISASEIITSFEITLLLYFSPFLENIYLACVPNLQDDGYCCDMV